MKRFICCVLPFLLFLSGCAYFKKDKTAPEGVSLKDSVKNSGYYAVVYFDIYSCELKLEAEDILMRAARLQAISHTHAYLSGHADKTGKKSSNVELSSKRVEAVKKYLKDLGVSEEYITTEYFGDEHPAQAGDDLESYAKNRRVEIALRQNK